MLISFWYGICMFIKHKDHLQRSKGSGVFYYSQTEFAVSYD